MYLTPDECHPESLHAASGRIMLEERTSFIPMVAKAMEFYLCDDTMFYVQLWEPMEGRKHKLVWSKDIIPDENSGGGYRRTVCESPIFILFSMLLSCPEFQPTHLLLPSYLLNAKLLYVCVKVKTIILSGTTCLLLTCLTCQVVTFCPYLFLMHLIYQIFCISDTS